MGRSFTFRVLLRMFCLDQWSCWPFCGCNGLGFRFLILQYDDQEDEDVAERKVMNGEICDRIGGFEEDREIDTMEMMR
jgi:hypothetical protein